jgi:hypothetical protein
VVDATTVISFFLNDQYSLLLFSDEDYSEGENNKGEGKKERTVNNQKLWNLLKVCFCVVCCENFWCVVILFVCGRGCP